MLGAKMNLPRKMHHHHSKNHAHVKPIAEPQIRALQIAIDQPPFINAKHCIREMRHAINVDEFVIVVIQPPLSNFEQLEQNPVDGAVARQAKVRVKSGKLGIEVHRPEHPQRRCIMMAGACKFMSVSFRLRHFRYSPRVEKKGPFSSALWFQKGWSTQLTDSPSWMSEEDHEG
ncbi:MAG: hypothetical protein AAFO77_02325, partial [Pseudomonadota bacterium]